MKVTQCGSGKTYTIPMKDIEYINYFEGKNKKEKVKDAYNRLIKIRSKNPTFLFNAELFDFKTREPASDVVSGGVVHRLTQCHGIAFPNNMTAVFSWMNTVKAKDYVGGFPNLVRNGKKDGGNPPDLLGNRGRTAIGVGNGNLYVTLVPDGNGDITLDTLRNHMISVGATDAINLDGGGSTQFYAPNGDHFTTRPVRGFIGIWLKDGVVKDDVRTVYGLRTFLNIRQNPNSLSKSLGRLYNGNKVTVLKTEGKWCYIGKGWVLSSYLKK